MSLEFYESHIQTSIDYAQNKINLSFEVFGQQKLELIEESEKEIKNAKIGLTELTNQIILLNTNERIIIQRKLQLFQSRINEIEQLILNNKSRSKLFGQNIDVKSSITIDESIKNTVNSLNETNDIGKGILSTLDDQKKKLLNAHGNLLNMGESVQTTTSIVNKMEKTQKSNKIIMYSIICLLIFAILFIIYLSF